MVDRSRVVRETSLEAYLSIKESGKLSARRWEAYDATFNHGPLTSNEAFLYSPLRGNPNYRHNTNARMTELREMGVVKELGKVVCPVTGQLAILWDVTNRVPIDLPPRKTNKQIIAALLARIAVLEAEKAKV